MAPVVCYFGTYEADYERNRILVDGLRECGATVLECHEPMWQDLRHKTGVLDSAAALARLGGAVMRKYTELARRYLRSVPEHDVMVVGYLGHLDVLVAAPLARLRGKPLVFDAFISLFDTLVHDRALFPPRSVRARAAKSLDRLSCALADVVLVDTEEHAAYFAEELGVPKEKLRRVLVGADPRVYHPVSVEPSRVFTAFHYSKFAPLHGVRTILEAARILRGSDVRFVLVGGGQLERDVVRWIEELELDNLEHHRWMEPHELRASIARAGACLGIFGDTPKAARVIPNKVYQCMAVGAPIVTRDSPAIRELLRHEEHALLCRPADPRALADAILRLRDDEALRRSLANAAHELFLARCTPSVIGRDLLEELRTLR